MFLVNLRAGWKSAIKHRLHSILNILGFSVALSVVVLIGLFVQRELSTNRFHQDLDQIYKICGWSTPYPLVPTIAGSVPEIEAITNVARVKSRFAITWNEQREIYMQEGYLAVDPGFFDIFTFPVVAGNWNEPLPDARSVVLVESTAKALFGEENPIGQAVKTAGWGGWDTYVVTAVVADIPINSSIRFSALFRIDPAQPYGTSTIGEYWKGGMYEVFARLPRGIDVEAVNEKMQDVVRRNGNLDIGAEKVVLYPFADVYFDRAQLWSQFKGGEYGKVMIMVAIGVIILLMAIINFFNLSTASGMMRSKEIGLRKVHGATRGALIFQFLVESVLLAFVAMVIAILIDNLVIPLFGAFVGVPYPKILMTHGWEWALLIGGSLVVGCVAGSYPAFYLSGLVEALYVGRVRSGMGVVAFRKVLIVFQLTATMAIIACTLVITGQIQYMRNYDMGFDREQIICVGMDANIARQRQAFLSEVQALPAVQSMSVTSSLVGYNSEGTFELIGDYHGEERKLYVNYIYADTAFFTTFGIELSQGRAPVLPQEFGYVVLNEAAVRELDVEDPLELKVNAKVLPINEDGSIPQVGVSGVCPDFHYASLIRGIDPLEIIVVNDYPRGLLNLRVHVSSMGQLTRLMDDLKGICKKFDSERTEQIVILDDLLRMVYIKETKYQIIFSLFALFSVGISCFGLFGLILFANARRKKEIGVRKVYGSDVRQIIALLIRSYMGYVAIAFVVATPVVYYFMRQWLQGYPYRVGLHGWFFVLAGLITGMIVALTVGIQSWRAASVNPVRSLKAD